MHVMDEMIELFSTINQMEKGALGLFFEMNHIIGLSLTIYIGWFIFVQSKDIDSVFGKQDQSKQDQSNQDIFNRMHSFILF